MIADAQWLLSPSEYAGTCLYRLSNSLVLSALRIKVDRISDPEDGIFGPYTSTALGAIKPAEVDADAAPGVTMVESGIPFPTVARNLAKETVGDGRGVPEVVQLGESHPLGRIPSIARNCWLTWARLGNVRNASTGGHCHTLQLSLGRFNDGADEVLRVRRSLLSARYLAY